MKKKLLLLDGHSIMNRAFYGIPDMTNVKGEHTNAIYGFLNIMMKFIDEEKPDMLCIAFDTKAPTFRHEIYGEYKGTRKGMPQELHEQVPVLQKLLQAMNITIYSRAGWEADDILGTLAKRAEEDDIDVTLVSGDRDLLQISGEGIKIAIPKTKGGKTETENYYPTDVYEKYHVTPAGIIDLKALMGDSSDNIPGVPKVGEKTAAALLTDYGSLDGVYENIDKITKKALHDNLVNFREQAYLSRVLATIKTDCDIELCWDELRIQNMWNEDSRDIIIYLGLKSFLGRFGSEFHKETMGLTTSTAVPVSTAGEWRSCLEAMSEARELGIYILPQADTTHKVMGIAALPSGNKYAVYSGEIDFNRLLPQLIEASGGAAISTFDIKHLYKNMEGGEAIDLWNWDDCLIMAYLNNPLKSDYTPEDIGIELLNENPEDFKSRFQKLTIDRLFTEKRDELAAYVGDMASVLARSAKPLRTALEAKGMTSLYRNIELPLTKVLFACESEGILVDRQALNVYANTLQEKIDILEKSVWEQAGEEFNINSPKQMGEILFGKLGIKGGKKTKSGYSTAADILEKLAPEYPIVNDILEYRTLNKLKSTYAEGLSGCIAEDGRIHTSFNQTITATGRISSTEPNLQNIPIRTDLGRQIRKCFVAKPGYVFVDADYSQIELRLLAHMSGDPGLLEAYSMGADIHSMTASKVFGVPFEKVTPQQRRNAKAVNFGIVYGISAFGLSKDLDIDIKEAERYIKDYFDTYPLVREYLDKCVRTAKETGAVSTLYGRIRPVPELKNSSFMVRSFGERVAMNSPLQGSAADIMKIAMINVYNRLQTRELDCKILLQVHDELLLEVREDQAVEACTLLKEEMEGAADLNVRLEADVSSGRDWYNL